MRKTALLVRGLTRYYGVMIAGVTLPLLTAPLTGWERLRVAVEAGQLRDPHAMLAGAGLASRASTALGWSLRPGTTAAGGVLHVLAASLAHVGGPLLAVGLFGRSPTSSKLAEGSADDVKPAEWFVAASLLPLVLSGMGNVVANLPSSFALALAGAALSARAGWFGASAMLALRGQARFRAAAAPAGLAVGVALLATSIRMVLPS